MNSELAKYENYKIKDLYFSRAGKASMNKFKILLDKDKILYGKKNRTSSPKTKGSRFFKPKFIGHSSSNADFFRPVMSN